MKAQHERTSRTARWSLRWLAVGLAASLLIHLSLELALFAIPWEFLSARHGAVRPPLPASDVAVLAALTLGAGALGAYAVRATRAWERPVDGWAMASATAAFAALLVAGQTVHRYEHFYAVAGGGEPTGMTAPLAVAFACFGAAFLLALVAVLTLKRRRTRGWALAAFGLVIPPWFGGVTWHELVYPLHVRGPSEAELSLPEGADAQPWFGSPREVRANVRLLADGTIVWPASWAAAQAEILFDPARPADRGALTDYLVEQARMMPKVRLDPQARTGVLVPDGPLLVLADADVAFERVLALLAVCAEPEVRIWKIQLGVRRSSAPWLGVLRCYLPRDGTMALDPPADRPRLRVQPDGAGGVRYRWAELETTDLAALAGRMRAAGDGTGFVLVELAEGARWRDAVLVLATFEKLRDAGIKLPQVELAGAWFEG